MADPDLPRLRGVVLDFDGLIADTETPVFQAWRDEARMLGGDLDLAGFGVVVGRNVADEEIVRLLLGPEHQPHTVQIMERVRVRSRLNTDQTTVRPGVAELIADIARRGLPLGVASSSPHSWLTRHLARLGLDQYFGAICGSDDVGGVAKPAPDVYLAALDLMQVKAANGLAVEDSVNGMAAAHAAGMRCVAVPGPITAGFDFSAAEAILTTLAGVDLQRLAASAGMRL
jgi:HAD superfamily hydrolase (TIGR01509 family)